MENSIKLIEISAEQAINHARNEYNPYEWKKQINQFNNLFEGTKFYEYNNEVFAIIINKGASILVEISYSHSINNGGFKTFILKGNELIKYPLKLSRDSQEDWNLAASLSSQGLVIANTFLSI